MIEFVNAVLTLLGFVAGILGGIALLMGRSNDSAVLYSAACFCLLAAKA